MDIGSTIKEIRKKKGLKQNELAEKAQMTQAYLSKIESNLKEPTISTLKTIANSLDVPLPILFFYAMTVDDVESQKRDAFKIILPSMKGMVESFI